MQRGYCGLLSLHRACKVKLLTDEEVSSPTTSTPHPVKPLRLQHTNRACTFLNTRIANMVYTLVVHLYAKDDQDSINKLIAKLQEASQVYSNDKECLGW